MENKIVGLKIKSLREDKGLSIDEVSQRAGLSVEQIEGIEGDNDLPALAPLIKIARVLGVRLGTFLDDHDHIGPVISYAKDIKMQTVVRHVDDNTLIGKHMAYHSLAPGKAGRHMEPFMIDIFPANTSEPTLSSHEGEEFLYVLEGTIEILYGKEKYVLNSGDSIYYDSIVPHHISATDGMSAKALGIVYMPF
jgi:transcriptional regulator with XRE-family HTH domain